MVSRALRQIQWSTLWLNRFLFENLKILIINIMGNNQSKVHSVHVHFHGTPTPEFMDAFNRMLDIAAEAADRAFLNVEENSRREEGEIKP